MFSNNSFDFKSGLILQIVVDDIMTHFGFC